MILKDMDDESIIELTGLTKKEIEEIKKNLSEKVNKN